MTFFTKYSLYKTSMSSLIKEKNINIGFKFFESPIRKTIQLYIYMLFWSDQTFSDQIIKLNNNKIYVTDKLLSSLSLDRLYIINKPKKIFIIKRKQENWSMLKTNISFEKTIK